MDFPSFIQMTTALIFLDAFSCSADKQEEELTIPQIAQISDLPEGTVKSRLHKAMNIIKQNLKQYDNR